jgi:uncharacterized small protein (DUF1192 family)
MDWDEAAKPKRQAVVGEDLSRLSVDDMKARIGDFRNEIARLEAEIGKRHKQASAADALFKKPGQ